MGQEQELTKAVGLADAYELLSYAFAYPNEQLVYALVDGSLAEDARACLEETGVGSSLVRLVDESLLEWRDASVCDVLADMRAAYSRFYLAPGGHVPIWPYESAFLHVERGLPGTPSLFRTPVTLDVERHMREAGVVAKNGRKEPCDSMFEEFEFLSYLHAKRADAINRREFTEEGEWVERICAFEREHVLTWLPSCMKRTQELAVGGPYAAFAALGLAVLAARS